VKKVILALLLVIVLLGLPASYYVIGLQAESALKDQLAVIQENYGPHFTLKEKSRGLFSSSYRYVVTYTLPAAAGNGKALPITHSFEVVEKVSHGPIPFAAGAWTPALAVLDTRLAPDQAGLKELDEFLQTVPELRQTSLRTTFGFGGGSRSRLVVPACKRTVTAKEGTTFALDWQGATAVCDVTAQAAAVTVDVEVPSLSIGHKAGTLSLKGLSLRSDTKLDGKNLYLGNSSLKLGDLQFQGGANERLSLTDLVIEGRSARRDAVVDGWLSMRGQGFGGKIQDKLTLDMSLAIRNLEFSALDTVMGEWERLSTQPVTFEERMRQWQAVLQAQVPQLFSRGPVVELQKCVLGVPAGSVDAAARLTYAGTGPLPGDFLTAIGRFTAAARIATTQPVIEDILRLAGQANPDLAAPEVRQEAEKNIQGLVASGFASREGDKLSSRADWDGKALTVNGKTLFSKP
jgi:uncharacterized protein YdgA (DUF945 family)